MASRIAEEIKYLDKTLRQLKPLIIRAEEHEAMLKSNLEDVRGKVIMYNQELLTVQGNLKNYIEQYQEAAARLKYLKSEEVSQSRLTIRETTGTAGLLAPRY